MPNYCSNSLEISGPYECLNKFWNENKCISEKEEENNYLCFNKSVSIPDDEKDNWYSWNIENWGTKWDSCNCDISEYIKIDDDLPNDSDFINYTFDTAWSPPLKWLTFVSKKYEDLEFIITYEEPGCDFWGKEKYKEGELIECEEKTYGQHMFDQINKSSIHEIIDSMEITKDNIEDQLEIVKEALENEDYEIYGNIDEFLEEYIMQYKNLD